MTSDNGKISKIDGFWNLLESGFLLVLCLTPPVDHKGRSLPELNESVELKKYLGNHQINLFIYYTYMYVYNIKLY